MEQNDLVTIYTVNSPPEAELIRGALQSAGIPCTIGGESQAGLAGVLSIDILVSATDAVKARKHLKQLRVEKKERKKARVEKRKAREADKGSEAIKEMKKPPSTDVK